MLSRINLSVAALSATTARCLTASITAALRSALTTCIRRARKAGFAGIDLAVAAGGALDPAGRTASIPALRVSVITFFPRLESPVAAASRACRRSRGGAICRAAGITCAEFAGAHAVIIRPAGCCPCSLTVSVAVKIGVETWSVTAGIAFATWIPAVHEHRAIAADAEFCDGRWFALFIALHSAVAAFRLHALPRDAAGVLTRTVAAYGATWRFASATLRIALLIAGTETRVCAAACFPHAACAAPIVVLRIPVVAFLDAPPAHAPGVPYAVAAARQRAIVVAVVIDAVAEVDGSVSVTKVALLSGIQYCIAANFVFACCRAPVAAGCVSIIAFLAGVHCSVAALSAARHLACAVAAALGAVLAFCVLRTGETGLSGVHCSVAALSAATCAAAGIESARCAARSSARRAHYVVRTGFSCSAWITAAQIAAATFESVANSGPRRRRNTGAPPSYTADLTDACYSGGTLHAACRGGALTGVRIAACASGAVVVVSAGGHREVAACRGGTPVRVRIAAFTLNAV